MFIMQMSPSLSHGLVIMDWLTSDLPPFNEIISSSKILSSSSLFIYSLAFKEICAALLSLT